MKRGDVIAVVETQKGAIEIEVFSAGVVSELVVPVGTQVPVGTVMARLDAGAAEPRAAGRTPPAPAGSPPAAARQPSRLLSHPAPAVAAPAAPAASPAVASPAAAPSRAAVVGQLRRTFAGWRRRRVPASPAARRLAAERGIALDRLTGSGPDGAVTLADVEAASAAPNPTAGPARPPPLRPGAVRRGGFDPAAMRQAIAAAMSRSKREIPHYYLTQTVEVTAALARLERLNRDRAPPDRLLPAALLLRATALALAKTPELNGFWEDGRFRPGDGVHIGWAIALRGGGLIAPAIRDADSGPLDELMAAMRDVVRRARSGGVRSSELTDPTHHDHQPRRTRSGERAADHLSAAGRDGRLRPHRHAPLGGGWRDRSAPCRYADAGRRSPRQRRPSRRPVARRDRSTVAGGGDAMNKAEAKALIFDVLGEIAPEAELDKLPGKAQLRDELDLEFDGLPQLCRRVA